MIPSRAVLAAALAAAACASPPEPLPVQPLDAAGLEACAALLASPPDAWPERVAAVFRLGAAATPALVAGLREHTDAPGGQAAVALLGRIGDASSHDYLSEQVAERTPLATEAALALGGLRATAAIPTLRACVDDRFADPTLRTAAACALVRCGEHRAAVPLLHAVLLAGTPTGAGLERDVGLPAKTRWALERYLVQRLLRDEGATELAAALDTDAPWPALAAVTQRIVAWLEQPR